MSHLVIQKRHTNFWTAECMSHLSWTERLIDIFLGPNGAWKFSSQFMSHLGFCRRTSSRSYQPLIEETSVAHLHVLSLVSVLAIGCAWELLHPRLCPPRGKLLQSSSVFFPTPPAMANTYLPFSALWPWCFHHWVLRYSVLWCIVHTHDVKLYIRSTGTGLRVKTSV